MEAAARPNLKLVNPETGEVVEDCPSCAEYADQVKGLEKDLRAWRARFANLARDLEAQARAHDSWDDVEALHGYWRRKCNHPRSRFGADEFNLAEPYWREYGADMCRCAIDGAAFDPYVTTRRNGSHKRHDGWDLIFKSKSKFEEFVNRAPREDK